MKICTVFFLLALHTTTPRPESECSPEPEPEPVVFQIEPLDSWENDSLPPLTPFF